MKSQILRTHDVGEILIQQISSAHILTAVLMSAPAGLAVSKIIYPEVEEPETRDLSKMQHQEDRLLFPFTVTFFSLDKSTVLV